MSLRNRAVIGTIFFWCSLADFATAQGSLKGAAAAHGVTVGAMIIEPEQNGTAGAVATEHLAINTIGYFWPKIRPERYTYDWADTDNRVQWAQANGLAVHLHPLVYASAMPGKLPQWVHNAAASDIPTIIEEHFDAIEQRYGHDAFDVIDVVNEPLEQGGSFRNTPYLAGFNGNGIDFIEFAFREARERFPNATLLWNDFGTHLPLYTDKFDASLAVFEELVARGVPIDGYGWQMHTNAGGILAAGFADRWAGRMQQITDLGLTNHVTELDVGIVDTTPAELDRQRQAYQLIGETFVANSTSDTFATWGISDALSWLAFKTPLLFDANYEAKPAFHGLLDAFSSPPGNADFDYDDDVDRVDLDTWEFGLGLRGDAALPDGDANGDGNVDGRDFLVWQQTVSSASAAVATNTVVPEPASFILLIVSANIAWVAVRCRYAIA